MSFSQDFRFTYVRWTLPVQLVKWNISPCGPKKFFRIYLEFFLSTRSFLCLLLKILFRRSSGVLVSSHTYDSYLQSRGSGSDLDSTLRVPLPKVGSLRRPCSFIGPPELSTGSPLLSSRGLVTTPHSPVLSFFTSELQFPSK